PNRSEVRARLGDLSRLPDSEPVSLARPVLKASTSGLHESRSQILPANQESVQFEDVSHRAGIEFQYDSGANDRHFIADTMGGGVGLLDFDGDGSLDIYFVNGCSIPWDQKNPTRPNRLYRNMGDGTFQDVTAKAGVAGAGYGMGCAVGDIDN